MARGAEQEARKPGGSVFRSLLGLDDEEEEPEVTFWGFGRDASAVAAATYRAIRWQSDASQTP